VQRLRDEEEGDQRHYGGWLMAVYAVTGKLGAGKGKAAMFKLREYLRAGKRVATNCDIFLEHMDGERSRATAIRVPDKPTATDLYMIGSGNPYISFTPNIQRMPDGTLKGFAPLESPKMLPGFDESHNGLLVLDECGSWINTRNFAEKGRSDVLEWMIHARKYGWDIFFVMQNINQADKQLRESLFEYVVRLTRLDRMRVPLVSSVVDGVTAGAVKGNLPRVHVAVVRLGSNPDGMVADRWVFRGDDLHQAYNTTQVFSDIYPHGTHSLLSPWHLSAKSGVSPSFVGPVRPGPLDRVLLRPRAEPIKPPNPHMTKFMVLSLCLGAFLGFAASYLVRPDSVESPAAVHAQAASAGTFKDKESPGLGFVRSAGNVMVLTQDGRAVVPTEFSTNDKGEWRAVVDGGLVLTGVQQ